MRTLIVRTPPDGVAECWAVAPFAVAGELTEAAHRMFAAKRDERLAEQIAADFAAALFAGLPIDSAVRRAAAVLAVPSRTPLPEAMARTLAGALGLPAPGAIRWSRTVGSVKGLDPAGRGAYLAGSMEAAPTAGTVVLVDDALRSGASLGEAARAVRAAGATAVAGACWVAIPPDHPW